MKQELEEWRPVINETLEEVLPRTVTPETLDGWFGTTAYTYDCEAIQHGLVDPVWELLDRGGKRWRAVLLLVLLEGFGQDPEEYLEYACIPELIHNGTLIVDDIEDDADMRRHEPPAHEQFGTDVAINAGNFLYFYPVRLLISGTRPLKPSVRDRLLVDYVTEMNRLHLGQCMDIKWQDRSGSEIDLDAYRQMCVCKTGGLCRLATRMAGSLVDKPHETKQKLIRGADQMALAFQISDDRLDVYHSIHETDTFGKEWGNDIKEGKITPLVIHALEEAGESDRAELQRILREQFPSTEDVRTVLRILEQTGAVEYAEKLAREHAESAKNEFRAIKGLDETAVSRLEEFVDFTVTRNR